MRTLLNKLISELKKKVNDNLSEIYLNQHEVRQALKMSDSHEKETILTERNSRNKQLLFENQDYLMAQIKIINLIDKYRREDFMKEEVPVLQVNIQSGFDYLKETVEGKLEYNKSHPLFNDHDFYHKLIEYYSSREEYEKCNELREIRQQQSCETKDK